MSVLPIQLNIVPRSEWCPTPPKWTDELESPVKYIYSTYTRKNPCFDQPACHKELLYLYNRQIKYGDKPDIIYNFLIGGDGTVYEGRGWRNKCNLPKRYDALENNCLAIAMLGTFQYRPPSELMKTVQKMLIKYGMDNGLIEKKITQFTT